MLLQSKTLSLLAAVIATAGYPSLARAQSANVTHIVSFSWQASDFHDPGNPGCSIGASGSAVGARLSMGASQRRPSPMNLLLHKQTWVIPAGTSIKIRAIFSDNSTQEFSGMGTSQAIKIDLNKSLLPAWVHALTINTSMTLQFSGNEPAWQFDLKGTSLVVNAMDKCLAEHGITGVDLPFGRSSLAETQGAAGATTQPFGGALPSSPVPDPVAPPQSADPTGEQSQPPVASAPLPKADPGALCQVDWHRCSDNADLANNYNHYYEIKAACQEAATAQARYGTPVWPGFWSGGAFASFLTGDSFPKTGIVVAIEPDVQFQNGFGAMVHSTATCSYNLDTKAVLRVGIEAHE